MKRFKTKQELFTTHPPLTFFEQNWGEPFTNFSTVGADKKYFTDAPHPYAGKDIIIKITTPHESERAQKKLFALGYRWHRTRGVNRDIGTNDLCVNDGEIMHSPNDGDYDTHIVLTFSEFMEGYLPGEAKQAHHKYWSEYRGFISSGITKSAGVGCSFAGSGEAKDTDAFIDQFGHLHTWIDGKVDHCKDELLQYAYMFNLMDEHDFNKKHPDKLKFKQWEVTVLDKAIKVGCQDFRKVDLKRFMEFAARATRDQSAHDLSMDDVLGFLEDNKIKLGL